MTIADYDKPFTTIPSAFAAAVTTASATIPAVTPSSITPAAFQAAVQSAVARAALAATKGPDTLDGGAVGGPTAGLTGTPKT